MSYRFKHWLDEHVTKLRRALANQQGGVEREQPKLSRPLLRPESEVFELSKVSGTFLSNTPLVGSWPLGWSELPCVCVFVSAGPVGWRGAPRNSWGQRTPRGLAGARCLAPATPHGGRSNDSRVLHPRQSEEWHLRLLQLDIVVFGNVIVIVFLRLLLSGWEALYCIWLTLT